MGNVIERAFELAKGGRMQSVKELHLRLRDEGFSAADLRGLSGRTIGRQLAALIKEARATPPL